jgi:hypothetical protein
MQIPGRWERDRHNHNLTIPFHYCSGKLVGRIYSNGRGQCAGLIHHLRIGYGLDVPELEMLSLAALVQWRVEARDEVDSGDDCGTFMGEVEVETDWAKNRRRSYQERNTLTKNLGDGVMVRLCEG